MSGDLLQTASTVLKEDKMKGGSEKRESVEPKDFFWDQFVKYISSAILGLTLLSTVEFFRDGGVACFHPPDTVALLPSEVDALKVYEFARDQATFINKFCVGSIPYTEYFPIYILVHGILLVAPHYIWSAIFKGDFDSFFSIAGRIDRLRTNTTGEYSEKSFDIVKKLEREYGGKNRSIFLSYIGKLFLQLVVCIVSVAVSAGWLSDFSFTFDCPRALAEDGVIPGEWPLNATVPCVYTSLRILRLVRVVDFILTGLAGALLFYGLLWCAVRHTHQLGYRIMAKFAFQSCLKPEMYVFPPIVQYRGFDFLKRMQRDYEVNVCLKYAMWAFAHRIHSLKYRNCFSPRIRNDLDFFLLTLFRADASHGKVFKAVQINTELQNLVGRDHQLLHLYINIQQDMIQIDSLKQDAAQRSTASGTSLRQRNGSTHGGGTRRGEELREDGEGSGHLDESAPLASDDEEDREESGRGSRCLATCWKGVCCLCLRKKVKKVEQSVAIGREESDTRMYADFRDYFTKAEFNGNPERIAFAHFKPHLGNLDFQEENLHSMRDMIYWFVCKHGKSKSDGVSLSNNTAVDLSFGTIGYALVLSRAFKTVYSVNFHPYYRATGKDVVREQEFFTNYYILTYPDNIYTHGNADIVQANRKILSHLVEDKGKDRSVDMIMVGQIPEEPLKVSITLFLNFLNLRKVIGDKALLLAVRPLRIGSKKVSSFKYEPSKKLFKRIKKEKLTPDQRKAVCRCVDGCKGYKVVCGEVTCIFEFEVYQFCGYEAEVEDSSADDEPQPVPMHRGPGRSSSLDSTVYGDNNARRSTTLNSAVQGFGGDDNARRSTTAVQGFGGDNTARRSTTAVRGFGGDNNARRSTTAGQGFGGDDTARRSTTAVQGFGGDDTARRSTTAVQGFGGDDTARRSTTAVQGFGGDDNARRSTTAVRGFGGDNNARRDGVATSQRTVAVDMERANCNSSSTTISSYESLPNPPPEEGVTSAAMPTQPPSFYRGDEPNGVAGGSGVFGSAMLSEPSADRVNHVINPDPSDVRVNRSINPNPSAKRVTPNPSAERVNRGSNPTPMDGTESSAARANHNINPNPPNGTAVFRHASMEPLGVEQTLQPSRSYPEHGLQSSRGSHTSLGRDKNAVSSHSLAPRGPDNSKSLSQSTSSTTV